MSHHSDICALYMSSVPPIPPFPEHPYVLPFGEVIPEARILRPPPGEDFCWRCVRDFLACLELQGHNKRMCDWVIIVNRKVYLLKWRDVTPRPPWTRQVWDIYRVGPESCKCPSAPVSLGWQWEWRYAIQTIWKDVKSHWQNGSLSGTGGTFVVTGTDSFQPGYPVVAPVGPVLYLDASDSSSLNLDANDKVAGWADKSTHYQDAVQSVPSSRPLLVPQVQNGLSAVRFEADNEEFMTIGLKAIQSWHIFIVGSFISSASNPKGTYLSATGQEPPFSGIVSQIDQSLDPLLEGALETYVEGLEIKQPVSRASPGSFGVYEWTQTTAEEGSVNIGINGFISRLFSGDTAQNFWDPMRQPGSAPPPIQSSIGRANWGADPGKSYDFLNGYIGQVLLYPDNLPEGERIQVLNTLRKKWELGPPLPFPPSC